MGFYDDRILPHLVEKTCGMPALRKLRRQACAGLTGAVVEIGFGSGLNVGLYPGAVTRISAVEPSDGGWKLAGKRVSEASVPIERAGLDGQRLPFADNTFDSALSTFTLCTIPDVAAALAELRRVVKPGGTVCFLEHGNAPDGKVRRNQRLLEPIQKRVAGGCHLTRDIPSLLTDAGLTITGLDQFYAAGAPRPYGAISVGTATV
ncbi:MAG: class I SAM-dependent methyltransferase [Gordonia amarae]